MKTEADEIEGKSVGKERRRQMRGHTREMNRGATRDNRQVTEMGVEEEEEEYLEKLSQVSSIY